jgi:hypothetical protein
VRAVWDLRGITEDEEFLKAVSEKIFPKPDFKAIARLLFFEELDNAIAQIKSASKHEFDEVEILGFLGDAIEVVKEERERRRRRETPFWKKKEEVAAEKEVEALLAKVAEQTKETNRLEALEVMKEVVGEGHLRARKIRELKDSKEFDDEQKRTVLVMRDAAREAEMKVEDVDYIVEHGKVVLIDHNTGFVKRGSRLRTFIHEMLEVLCFFLCVCVCVCVK